MSFKSEEDKLKSYVGELHFLGRHTIADSLQKLYRENIILKEEIRKLEEVVQMTKPKAPPHEN